MVTEYEKEIILSCARKYNVSSLFLFGSALESKENANDIDLGVKGIQSNLFFKFYGELIKQLPKPVDLVNLSDKSLFNDMVEKTGIKIYG